MRKIILAAAVLAALTAPASAQLKLNVNANDPVTGLGAADWEQLVGHILNAQSLVGDPGVLVVSSLPVPVTVTCDKWELVGPNVYKSVQGNPPELKPFSVTYIKTKDFDGYCKQGVIGHYGIGKTIVGKLTSSDGSFTEATTILFSGDDRNK
jgi:hypothetical protein